MLLKIYRYKKDECLTDEINVETTLNQFKRTPINTLGGDYKQMLIDNKSLIKNKSILDLVNNKVWSNLYLTLIDKNNPTTTSTTVSPIKNRNKEWRTKLESMKRKATLFCKVGGFGNTSRIELPYYYSDESREVAERVKGVSSKISKVWADFIKGWITDHSKYDVIQTEQTTVSIGRPDIHINKLLLVPKGFKLDNPLTDDNQRYMRLKWITVKFKYDRTYIDFSKPSITHNSYSSVSKGLDMLSHNSFIKYIDCNSEGNINIDFERNRESIMGYFNGEKLKVFRLRKIEEVLKGFKVSNSITNQKALDDKYYSGKVVVNFESTTLKRRIGTLNFNMKEITKKSIIEDYSDVTFEIKKVLVLENHNLKCETLEDVKQKLISTEKWYGEVL